MIGNNCVYFLSFCVKNISKFNDGMITQETDPNPDCPFIVWIRADPDCPFIVWNRPDPDCPVIVWNRPGSGCYPFSNPTGQQVDLFSAGSGSAFY